MPPQRRRRPVQPATHVRLPRAARPRGASGTDITDPETPDLETPDLETPEPETPDLEKPEPEAPEPETPDLEKPELEAPEPETPDLERPEPEAPEPETPDLERPEPETPEPEAQELEAQEVGAPEREAPEPGLGEAPVPAGERRGPLALPAALGVIAVILGGLAVWFGLEAGSATSGVDTSNVALTDPAATSRLTQQIATAVNTIFSYNYADTTRTSQAAATLLTGRAQGEYNTLFRLVRQDAPKEKLVLTTTVTNAGVEYLIGNQARLLIFANQKDTAGAAHNATEAGAMFAVNAVYTDGRWKIAHIDTFGASG